MSALGLSAALLSFSFQVSLLFFQSVARQLAPALRRKLVLIRNIGHRTLPKIRVGTFLVRNVHSGDLELILMVKMETRHPVEGQFDSEFPAICNHSRNFCGCFWKKDPYGKICKIMFRKFLLRHRSTFCAPIS